MIEIWYDSKSLINYWLVDLKKFMTSPIEPKNHATKWCMIGPNSRTEIKIMELV